MILTIVSRRLKISGKLTSPSTRHIRKYTCKSSRSIVNILLRNKTRSQRWRIMIPPFKLKSTDSFSAVRKIPKTLLQCARRCFFLRDSSYSGQRPEQSADAFLMYRLYSFRMSFQLEQSGSSVPWTKRTGIWQCFNASVVEACISIHLDAHFCTSYRHLFYAEHKEYADCFRRHVSKLHGAK